MPRPPKNLYSDYEKELLKSIRRYSQRIQRLYNDAIVEITLSTSTIKYTSNVFTLDVYPVIKKKVDAVLKQMQKDILQTVNQAAKEAWDLSNRKNDVITRSVLGKRSLPKNITDKLFNPNLRAYESFIRRKDDGLDLSQRIWKFIKPFRHEIEAGLAAGINDGKSAAAMATEMKRFLKEPDKLFRRVRDENGKLKLSKAAQAYKPGQGVYRSSYKNALRVTRTETNMSYRSADHERWLTMPFVLGIEIKLSDEHPKYDICDPLTGRYPKQFNWGGWHPQCMCYAVPVLANDKDFNALEDQILGINDKPVDLKYITEMPEGFKEYLAKNKKRMEGWKKPPYWLKDNPQLTGKDAEINYTDRKTVSENVGKLTFREKDFGTDALYRDVNNNGFVRSRLEFHSDLVEEYLKAGSTNLGTSYFMGGAPATGKSSILESGAVKLPEGILTIDPDKVKGMLPEYNEMIRLKDPNAAHKVHEESSILSKGITATAAKLNYDIVSDGVGDGSYESIVKKVQQQRDAGKRVVANYVTTDTELSVQRATARAKRTGRKVPEQYIRNMHSEISKLVPRLAQNGVFDELRVFNNEGPEGSKPVLIFEQIGNRIRVHNQRLYQKFLSQAR